jgi:peptidoglycan/LPS O-acetylase OafA/YrhL
VQRYLVLLDLTSLIKVSALVGLGASLILAPISAVMANLTGDGNPVLILILGPVLGLLNGALCGLIGYPLYRWASRKSKPLATLSGFFQRTAGHSNNRMEPDA